RGLGDPAGRTSSGIPLLQLIDDPEMIGVLLEAGLDPNAADVHAASESGRTGEETLRESGGVAPRGRDDWLEAGQVTTSDRASSGVSLQPDPLRPGEVGTLTIILGNSSQQDRVLEVQAILNNAVFFVGASHDGSVEDAVIPGLTSTVRWPPLALPGATRGKLEMTVLARPHDALPDLPTGDLSVDVRVIDLPQRSEEVLQLYQTRAGEAARTELDNPMALWPIVLPLVLVVALWLVWRRAGGSSSADKRFRRGRALAAGSALICFGIALAMAWSMLEPFVNFEEASCRILDRRVFAREVETTTQTRGTRRGNWQRTMQGHPLVAVEIDHGDEHRIAAGLATGMGTRSAHELRSLPIGSEKSCWLDPHNRRRFTLVREPSLGGVVGLGLVLALAVIFSAIAIRLRQGAVIRSE
ncbi:MAG: hypothetical protein GY723_15205, partial [bacterium]|nr:hypothetical protein [bacterium]